MATFFAIMASSALSNNLLLVHCLGLSSLFAYSHSLRTGIALALTSFVVLFSSALLNAFLYYSVLLPLNLVSLRIVAFVLISASLTFLLMKLLTRYFPVTTQRQALTLLTLSGNGAALGLAVLITLPGTGLMELSASNIVAAALGGALGVSVLILLFAGLRQRLDATQLPAALQGAPSYLISAGIVAMALLGFSGI
ncbi:MAG: Rnf-Nqr domain containing protein [Gammaproteobacteria bacterium]